ncbi:MAG: Rpn family recombination-promoting nuclease/putative transposase [Ruminococcus sp.]|nr:Rpn family recombination-promoting nuclease/putative transposase [Ruminococcus sp.]
MQEQDVTAIEYFEDKARLADLLNVAIFEGNQLIKEEDIQEKNRSDSLILRNGEKKNYRVISRDIVRKVKMRMKIVIVAIENQSEVHYAMPVRVMSGDCSNYHSQWRKIAKQHKEKKDLQGAEFLSGFSKKDRLIPVITIVLYFGKKPWDGPKCLKDMFDLTDFPEKVSNLIADYPIQIIEVRRFEHCERFCTDLQWVFGFLQKETNPEDLSTYLKKHEDEFANLAEDAYDLLCQYAHSWELEEVKNRNRNESGGIDMCQAIREMIENGRKEGLEQGLEQGIKALVETCQEVSFSIEHTWIKIQEKFNLEEDKAKEYVNQFWK